LAEFCLAQTAEHEVREFGSAETEKADQPFLLLDGGRPLLGFDGCREADRSDVVACTLLPALRQGTIADEVEVRSSLSASS
jgi:hypothetical protein